MTVDRFDDFVESPGRLQLHESADGDIKVYISCHNTDEHRRDAAGVLFVSPRMGGASPRTVKALRDLMLAMAEDNADQDRPLKKRGEYVGEEIISTRKRENAELIKRRMKEMPIAEIMAAIKRDARGDARPDVAVTQN